MLTQGAVLAGGLPSARWQMGATAPGVEVAVSVPCLTPHNPQLVLPCGAVFTLAVTVLTLPLQGMGECLNLSSAPQVPSAHLAGGRVGAGCRQECREETLGGGRNFGGMGAHEGLCL